MPWYKEWTGVNPAEGQRQVCLRRIDRPRRAVGPGRGLRHLRGAVADQGDARLDGTQADRRAADLMPADLDELKRIAPDVEFIPVKSAEEAAKVVGDADAVLGFCTPEIVKAGQEPALDSGRPCRRREGPVAGTGRKQHRVDQHGADVTGRTVADQAFALLLSPDARASARRAARSGRELARSPGQPQELHGKTMLVVGLGGIGTQIARRAMPSACACMAVDPKDMERPDFVFSLDKPAKLMDLLPKADVVVLACPLTTETTRADRRRAVRGDEADGVPHQRGPRRPSCRPPTWSAR